MIFSEVPLSNLLSLLKTDFFKNENDGPYFHFTPSDLLAWARKSDFTIQLDEIKNWEAFEYGLFEFNEVDFKKFIFNGHSYTTDTEVYFISDNTLMEQLCIKFPLKDFDTFVIYHQSRFRISIVQPSDIIVVLMEYKRIVIIYHEGQIITIEKRGI
jgi:hypothetical protein